jgi:hypothetical protein
LRCECEPREKEVRERGGEDAEVEVLDHNALTAYAITSTTYAWFLEMGFPYIGHLLRTTVLVTISYRDAPCITGKIAHRASLRVYQMYQVVRKVCIFGEGELRDAARIPGMLCETVEDGGEVHCGVHSGTGGYMGALGCDGSKLPMIVATAEMDDEKRRRVKGKEIVHVRRSPRTYCVTGSSYLQCSRI